MRTLSRDLSATGDNHAAAAFTVGGNLAATPGKVVFRDTLMELIQYAPATAALSAEPVLIVPSWVTKYYILDLSSANSFIFWLVSQGRTVFVISWRNPGMELHDASFDDYRVLGIMAAIDAVRAICGDAKIHATGYCLGGTLLSIAAATMARDDDDRLASLSLFVAQTDFSDVGELQLFITEDQLDVLSEITRAQGYLESAHVIGTYQMSGPTDLVWDSSIRDYLIGEHETPKDILAWNADGTRVPPRMHIEYLRRLFLHNDLAMGRFHVAGRRVTLNDMRLPMFVVGTERDQRSVYKLHLLNDGELTFVLTSGGHNAGIVSEPGHENRHYRIRVRKADARTLTPDEWERETTPKEGSWWYAWSRWLDEHSSGAPGSRPPMGSPRFPPICDAPGSYVLEMWPTIS